MRELRADLEALAGSVQRREHSWDVARSSLEQQIEETRHQLTEQAQHYSDRVQVSVCLSVCLVQRPHTGLCLCLSVCLVQRPCTALSVSFSVSGVALPLAVLVNKPLSCSINDSLTRTAFVVVDDFGLPYFAEV